MIYCENCRGTNIEEKWWVNVNTKKLTDWCGEAEHWCSDCEEFVDITEEEIE